jgi:hypothetical protein
LSNLITIFLTGPANAATLFGVLPMAVVNGPVGVAVDAIGTVASLHTDDSVSGWQGVEPWPGTGAVPPTDFGARITNISPTAWAAPSVSASVGQANTVGALSVPPTWTVSAPAVRPVALASPATNVSAAGVAAAAAEEVEIGSGSAFSQMGLAGMLGPAMVGAPAGGNGRDDGKAAAGKRAATLAATGDRGATDGEGQVSADNPRIVVTGVAARIRELAKLRDEGRLTEEEFTEQKNRLLGR